MINLRKNRSLSPTDSNMPDLAEFMTTEDASKILKLHVVTIRNMIRIRKLEGLKIGGKTWLVSKKSVEKYRNETRDMSKNDPRRGRN
ncbi:MAG TPA: helix-turn-helix domain-containing protein [Anaerolineales bacterium]